MAMPQPGAGPGPPSRRPGPGATLPKGGRYDREDGTDDEEDLRAARGEDPHPARRRGEPGRPRGAHGRRAHGLRHAHRRRGGLPERGQRGGCGLRHRLRERRHPHRPRHRGPRGPRSVRAGCRPRTGLGLPPSSRTRERPVRGALLRNREEEPGRRCAGGRSALRRRRVGHRTRGRRPAGGSPGQGPGTARDDREREPLRGRLRRRRGDRLGRGPLREPGLRSHRGLQLPGPVPGGRLGGSGAGEGGAPGSGYPPGGRLLGPHESRRPLRLRRPGVGRPEGRPDAGGPGGGAGPQSPQLRLARRARRRGVRRGPEGRHAGLPGAEGLRGGVHGGRRRHPPGHGLRPRAHA